MRKGEAPPVERRHGRLTGAVAALAKAVHRTPRSGHRHCGQARGGCSSARKVRLNTRETQVFGGSLTAAHLNQVHGMET